MAHCLVDTSSWVEALRHDGDHTVRARVAEALAKGQACLCDMVLLELWNGARGEQERRELARLEQGLAVLPTDGDTWYAARELARTCRTSGYTIPVTDLLVYACARRHAAALEHHDEHFDLIARACSEVP